MIYLLDSRNYSQEQNEDAFALHTKHYQHIEVDRFVERFAGQHGIVCEIGPHSNFRHITTFPGFHRAIIDPYNNAPGAGISVIPETLPYPVTLYRCLLGADSDMIPSSSFDVTFSVSVIEHIGQAEAGYDCNPTDNPPEGQEAPRNAFCRELFRVMKPGGITFHTVDHAARNLSFRKNFLDAGFVPLEPERPVPTIQECLKSPTAIRQRRLWAKPQHHILMPDDEQPLHSVLMMAFVKPKPPRLKRYLRAIRRRLAA